MSTFDGTNKSAEELCAEFERLCLADETSDKAKGELAYTAILRKADSVSADKRGLEGGLILTRLNKINKSTTTLVKLHYLGTIVPEVAAAKSKEVRPFARLVTFDADNIGWSVDANHAVRVGEWLRSDPKSPKSATKAADGISPREKGSRGRPNKETDADDTGTETESVPADADNLLAVIKRLSPDVLSDLLFKIGETFSPDPVIKGWASLLDMGTGSTQVVGVMGRMIAASVAHDGGLFQVGTIINECAKLIGEESKGLEDTEPARVHAIADSVCKTVRKHVTPHCSPRDTQPATAGA